ncbi:unnamed protein product [Adineta ricciae]|uniref:NAD(P)(+)--arginine ADP-ribosyltransferase n=1 Tax=Adineta ricciae TaxID=249248 RepID=A0A815ZYT3_ADIRI|nr:unnamed protein product [Adineta ricciae]CAF1591224.1 unnamed protein product [Adineta ricciae]
MLDKNRQRPIRRQNVESTESFAPRAQRFNPIELPSKTFLEGSGFSKFIFDWANQYNNSSYMLTKENVSKILELAADGIEQESQLCEEQYDRKKGIEFAKKLREMKNQSLSDIGKYCIYIYTVECFLYLVLNYTLRNEDQSKLKTLGPYCFLLQNSLWNCRETNKQTQQRVYRGGRCKIQHIEQYKSAIGQIRCWSAFSSTTKKPEVTNTFTASLDPDEVCTVFIIDIIDRPFTESFGLDISSLSAIKKEAEVLLPAGINFTIISVEYDKTARKCTIHLTI